MTELDAQDDSGRQQSQQPFSLCQCSANIHASSVAKG